MEEKVKTMVWYGWCPKLLPHPNTPTTKVPCPTQLTEKDNALIASAVLRQADLDLMHFNRISSDFSTIGRPCSFR